MKIGQTIKCINDKDSNSLYLNGTYRITDINQYGNIQVAQSGSEPLQHYYKQNRFELVAESVAKIDIAKQYRTEKGDTVKLFAISDDGTYPVIGQYFEQGSWYNEQWTLDGRYMYNVRDISYDLVEVVNEIAFEFPDLNTKIKITKDLSVLINSSLDHLRVSLNPEVMDRLIVEYQKMKNQ